MDVEKAIQTVVQTFKTSAGQDGLINKQEFCKLLRTHLRHYLTGTGYKQSEEEFWKKVMTNNPNGKMNFNNYLEFVHILVSRVRETVGGHQLQGAH
ncbi:hypothetical protein AALO_G00173250 [Alosa alosa]|uniref:S100/CaBP-9k-type calcium binding subdomain domain-containing protein n=1 Tax=Alosa alosa TaxID=278164 RepID=A0AAV6GAH9_9TELE|nr:hypothetical protein AALO_G00173250 [Alosa alosa]